MAERWHFASVAGSGLRHTRHCALLLAAGAALLLGAAPSAAQVPIRTIEWSYVAPDPQAGPDGGAEVYHKKFDLPLRWSAIEGSPLRTIEMRMRFTLAAPPEETWALLLERSSEGGRFRVNGHIVGTVAAASPTRFVDWHRPQLITIDPSLLVAGENEVLVETRYGPGAHILAGVQVGPLSNVWNRYALVLFFDYQWMWASACVALLTAVVFGILGLQRKQNLALLVALASLFWLIHCGLWLAEIMPLELRFWTRIGEFAATGAFSAVIAVTLLRMSSVSRRGEEWLIWAYAAIGPVFSLATSLQADHYLQFSWQPGLILIVAIATGLGVARRTRGQPAPAPIVLVAAIVLLAAALFDLGTVLGWTSSYGSPAMNYAGILMLIGLATPLMDGLVRTVDQAESARAELEMRVREREQLLKRNFERLRESERGKVEAQERQRIMQDMHDGLGSQLMSSLMLVERGAVSNDQFAQILRESIDDMRLAIDALASEDADLAAALGNLRFRMEPRLRAAGMELAWDARKLPEEIGLHPDEVLPILRIVQEALTNALKHSRAREVRVTLAVEGTAEGPMLDIRIADNGRGIDGERVGGRGLMNMRNRAQKINAQLKVATAPKVGTTVHLRTRVLPTSPTTRSSQTVLNTQAVIERARMQ